MARTTHRKSPKRTAVVVLSMHRSGTSALTRVLGLLGCTLPQTLIAGRKNDNITGFWESQAVVDVNEAICMSAGSNWNDWVPLSQGWLSSPVREGFVDQALEVLENEFGDSQLFVLKDPRLCRLMPVWAEALERFKAFPVYVLPVRNPLEVAASLRKRNQLVEGDSYLAWLRHMLDAERHSRGQPRVFVRFDEVLGNWRKTADRISGKLGLSWPNRSISAENEIDAFLAPDLRHHSIEDTRVFEDSRLLPWITQCYEVMSRWTHDETRDGDVETLDRINAEMNATVPAFEAIVAETRALGRKHRDLAKRLEMADTTAHEQRKTLEATQAERDRVGANLDTARAELAQLHERASQADTALARRLAELGEATDNLKTLREEIMKRDEQLRNIEGLRATEREEARRAVFRISQEARNRLVEQESALAAMREEIKTLHDRVSKTGSALIRARGELEERSNQQRHHEASAAAERVEHTRQLEQSQRRSADATAHARSLLGDYMHRVQREIHRPGPQQFFGLFPSKRAQLRNAAMELGKAAEELRASTFFDAEWYLTRYEDVAKAGMDPALHFIEYGFQEGRAPSARFEEK